jgi:hypothetical protein
MLDVYEMIKYSVIDPREVKDCNCGEVKMLSLSLVVLLEMEQ